MNNFKRTTRTETRNESSSVETVETGRKCATPADSPTTTCRRRNPVPSKVHWDYLKTFEIQSPPAASVGGVAEARLFANNNQRMPIIVVLSPRLTGGEYVGHLIPESEILEGLTLVKYNDGAPLPSSWHIDKEKSPDGYVWDPSYISIPTDKSADDYAAFSKEEWPRPSVVYAKDQLEVTIYVRAEDAVKNTSVRAAASITPPGASQPIQTRPGSSGGSSEFDSSVIISARPSPIVTIGQGDYADSLTINAEPVRYDNKWARARDWTVTLRLMGKVVPLKRLEDSSLQAMWWCDGSWGPWEFTFVTTAQPETLVPLMAGLPGKLKTLDGDYDFPTSRWIPTPHVVNYRGKVAFLMVNSTEDYHFFYGSGAEAPQIWENYYRLFDEAGNVYQLKVDIDTNHWDTLRICSWSRRDSRLAPHAGERCRGAPQSEGCVTTRKTTKARHETSEIVETVEEWSGALSAQVADSYTSLPAGHPSREVRQIAETAWSTLKTFRVESVPRPDNIGYPGETKTGVQVTLAAMDAENKPVTIPDEELARILTLVNYESGLALPGEWAVEPVGPGEAMPGVQTYLFWVKGSVPCPSPASVAASITPPGGLPPIQTRPEPSGGNAPRFDSKVELWTDPDPRWTLSVLTISSVSSVPKVYANGLQQIEVKVELAFNDNLTLEPGEPTQEELESLTIAFFDGGRPVPPDAEGVTGWCVSPGFWASGDPLYHKGCLSYPGVRAEPGSSGESPSPQASTFRYFYLVNRGGRPGVVSLCACVKSRDGWTYLSNGTAFNPCGKLYSSQSSQLEVTAVNPVEGTIGQYPWVMKVLSGDDGDGGVPSDPASVHQYKLSFVDKFENTVGFRAVTSKPAGMIQWHDKVSGEHRACYTGYAQPGDTSIQWEVDSLVPAGPSAKPTLPAPVTDQISVVLVGRANIPYASGKENGPMVLTAIDGYGTTHTLYVDFEGTGADGRWKLVITK